MQGAEKVIFAAIEPGINFEVVPTWSNGRLLICGSGSRMATARRMWLPGTVMPARFPIHRRDLKLPLRESTGDSDRSGFGSGSERRRTILPDRASGVWNEIYVV